MAKSGKKKKKIKKKQEEFILDQDEYFYFIAGYTSGGAPYGITWEQAREEGLIDADNESFGGFEEFE